ncbi:MAG: hypothetical protein V7459_09380 [Oceanicoccus sp.]
MIKTTQFTTVVLATLVLLVSACGANTETPVSQSQSAEPAPQIQETAIAIEEGAIAGALVVRQSTDESEEAFIATSEIEVLNAKVVSFNLETREVVLVGEDGVEFGAVAGEKMPNLDQVAPGDMVHAKFAKQITIELVKGEGAEALEMSVDRKAQAEEGTVPARAEMKTAISVYTVEAINLEANTFVLKNAKDEVEEFTIRNPVNLTKASVGDAVVVTTVKALAVEVTKADPAE